MSAAAAELKALRRRWTRAEFDRVGELGAFHEQRVELVEGELIDMAPEGVPHGNLLEYLSEQLHLALGRRVRFRTNQAFAVDDSTELVPDIAMAPRSMPKSDHPTSALLVIEVSQRSLRYDRLVKSGLYARAGVGEYWVVDVARKQIEIFGGLRAGKYGKQTRHSTGVLRVPGFPEAEIELDRLFAETT
jgi:Uma2 family endonuclease